MAYPFCVVDDALATGLRDAIGLSRNLADKELRFARMAQVEGRLHDDGLGGIGQIRKALLVLSIEQVHQLHLDLGRAHYAAYELRRGGRHFARQTEGSPRMAIHEGEISIA